VSETERGTDSAGPFLYFVIDTGTDHASEALTFSTILPQGTLSTSWSLSANRLESGLSAASVEYFVHGSSRGGGAVGGGGSPKRVEPDTIAGDAGGTNLRRTNVPACKAGTNMIKTQDTEMGQSSTLLDVTTPITCFRLGTLGVHLLRCCLSPRTRALLVGAHYSYQFLLCTYVSSRSTQHVVLVGVLIYTA